MGYNGEYITTLWQWQFASDKAIEIVDLPTKNGAFLQLCKRLPEGGEISWPCALACMFALRACTLYIYNILCSVVWYS